MLDAIAFKKMNLSSLTPEGVREGSQGQAQRRPWSAPLWDCIPEGCEKSIVVPRPISHPFRMLGAFVIFPGVAAQPLATIWRPLRGR
jgi:hypothetical protein